MLIRQLLEAHVRLRPKFHLELESILKDAILKHHEVHR